MNIQSRLARDEVVIIDGAIGTELQRRGCPMHMEVWTAAALLTHSDTLRGIHRDFALSGAEIHTACTYNTAPHILNHSSVDTTTRELNTIAVRMVREGLDAGEPEQPVWIAGSISTAVASRREEKLDLAELRASYTEQSESLAEAGCDLLLLEMMLTHEFAIELDFQHEIAAIAKQTGLPVWAGISLKRTPDNAFYLHDGSTDSGPQLEKALTSLLAMPIDLAGIMHSDVEVITPALGFLERFWSGPTSVYPNCGTYRRPEWQFVPEMTPAVFAEHALQWKERGVKAIGGCCGIGPEHIAELSRMLREAGGQSR